jgi:hypothetical protein
MTERYGEYRPIGPETREVQRLSITRADYDRLRSIETPRGQRLGRQWDLVFSVDLKGQIFPYNNKGKTPEDARMYIRGDNPTLDTIADVARASRGEGGRFFVDSTGVFFKDKARETHLCVELDIQQPPTAE